MKIQLLLFGLFVFTHSFVLAQTTNKWDTDSTKTHTISYQKGYSPYYEHWYIKYEEFVDSDDDLIVPISFGYGHSKIKSKKLKAKNLISASISTFDFGFDGYIKLHKGIYFCLGAKTIIGVETFKKVNKNKASKFLIGGHLNQGIRLIPWQEFGVVLGISISERLQNSKFYTSEFGWALEIGINF